MKATWSVAKRVGAGVVSAILLTAVAASGAPATNGAPGATAREELRQQRKKAAQRVRRIIFNNDGDDVVYECEKATPEALLECRTTALVGSQVDSIFYCTWSSGFGCFTHNTKVGEVFTCKAEGFGKNKTGEFIRQGTDPLAIMVDFCRRHELEIFWSMRMNDTHDAWGGWYSPYLFPQLKKDHPEYLVASKERRSKVGGWTAVDYGRPEIRDLAFRYVEEVCRNYDVDGVELDFFRHAVFFKRHAMGGDVGQQERDMMTGLLRRIRTMTEEVGLQRGRPILVAVRVPDSVDYSAAIGLDVVSWLEEDLIDVLIPSGYFRLNPWEVSVELGHKYGVPVYPCLSESRLAGEARQARASLAGYRARAVNVWAAGADGVYMFNSFNPRNPLWRELGDPKALESMDKVYTTGARGVRVIDRWLARGRRFLNRSPVSPESPLPLPPGKAATVALRVGQRVEKAPVPGTGPEVELHLQVEGLADAGKLSVSLNGKPLGQGVEQKPGNWLVYPVDPGLVEQGENRFEIVLEPGDGAKPAVLTDLLLWVRHRKHG